MIANGHQEKQLFGTGQLQNSFKFTVLNIK